MNGDNEEINFERERYTIGLVIDAVKTAWVPLAEKKKELEAVEDSNSVHEELNIVLLRLDALAKVVYNLLEPMQEEYTFLDKSIGVVRGEDLPAMIDERNKLFCREIMKGL